MQLQRSVLRGHLFPRERRGKVHVFSRVAMLPLLAIAGLWADHAMDFEVFKWASLVATVFVQDWAARVGWQVDGKPVPGLRGALFRRVTGATALQAERLIDGGKNTLRNLWRRTQGLPERSLEQYLQEKVEADTLDLLP
jgi:hypothetical protein